MELANDRLHVGLMTDDPAMLGVGQLGIRLAVRDLEAARHWFGHVLGWEVDGAAFRLGASVMLLEGRWERARGDRDAGTRMDVQDRSGPRL